MDSPTYMPSSPVDVSYSPGDMLHSPPGDGLDSPPGDGLDRPGHDIFTNITDLAEECRRRALQSEAEHTTSISDLSRQATHQQAVIDQLHSYIDDLKRTASVKEGEHTRVQTNSRRLQGDLQYCELEKRRLESTIVALQVENEQLRSKTADSARQSQRQAPLRIAETETETRLQNGRAFQQTIQGNGTANNEEQPSDPAATNSTQLGLGYELSDEARTGARGWQDRRAFVNKKGSKSTADVTPARREDVARRARNNSAAARPST
ncbi:hypothetical protein LTR09_011589 [Extremus antarcticus]|uniref:Uncharacterized protein n=1 Tax=Extremus antarcticus TaxID=702011 RepID=A0AAJ0G7R6_9PEZI|nr:hypothetical protein LTR09_011589 [Extremus antarcticus]